MAVHTTSELGEVILENSTACMFMMDARGYCTYMNRAGEQMFGFTFEEIREKPLHEVVHHHHPDGRPYPMAECPIERALPENSDVHEREDVFIRKNGEFFPVLVAASPIFDATGHPISTVIEVRDVTERKRAEEALRKSEAHVRSVLDNLFAFVGVMTPDGTLVEVNRAPLEAAGIAASDVVGKKFWDCYWWSYSPEIQAQLRDAIDRACRGEVVRYDVAVRMVGDSRMWIDFQIAPLRDCDGRITHLIPSAMDLTARKQAEEALRKSEATLNAVLDALPVGVVIADTTGKFIRMNAANDALWGLPPNAKSWEQYGEVVGYSPETGKRLEAHEWPMARALLHGEVVTGDLIECEPVGARPKRYSLISAAPVRDGAGNIIAGVVAELDVTKRLAAERALRENEQRIRLAGEAAGIGFWSWDVQSNTAEFDEICAALFGLGAGATIPITDVITKIHPQDRERIEAALSRALLKNDRLEVEFRVILPDGATRWLGSLGNAVRERGKPVKLAGVNWDVTARKQAEIEREQLLESERAARSEAERASRIKDEFLSTVSHELRTPLSAILGWAQILRLRVKEDNSDLVKGITVIERNARVQVQLIEDLLDMGRIVSGKVRIQMQPVNLDEVVAAAAASVAPSAEAKQIQLEIRPSPIRGALPGDPSRLQQVVWNLLSNAIKFTPKGGKVDVAVTQTDDLVHISVSDTGQGINPEFLPYVFERFRQADSSTTRQHGGLGLGLSIVKHLVDLHGGAVRATSDGPGKGSTFIVDLPLGVAHFPGEERDELDGPSSSESIYEVADLSGVSVLVVDDAADTLDVVKRLLEDRKARVSTAESGEEALTLLDTEPVPDVLVSDIGMPGIDGFELIRRVRAMPQERGRDMPAVALTAYGRAKDRTKALLAGFQTHVSKPLQPGELLAAIGALTGRGARKTRGPEV